MRLRLPLSACLLALSGFKIAAGEPDQAAAVAGLAIAVALALTVLVDAVFFRRRP
jgi:hypothetical protein